MFSEKTLKLITQVLLAGVIAIIPFLKANSLYFPFVSGKAYIFRLLVSLALFFWIWLFLKRKEYRPNFKNILIFSLVLFFFSQVVVAFFGVDPLLSFFSTVERADGVIQYGFWLLYGLMLVSVFRGEGEWKRLFCIFTAVAVLVCIYAWAHYEEQVRIFGIFGNSSYLAVFLIFAIGFAFIILERKFLKNIYLRTLLCASILFFVVSLIFTQTRGAYIGLAGGAFLFLLLAFLFLRKENKKLSRYCGIILLLGLILVSSLFIARKTSFVQNIYVLKHATEIADLWQNDVVRERLLVWQIALKSFQDRPVFGWGPENFGSAANKHYDYRVGMVEPWFDRAHNQPLDTLATGGIFLFVFYLFWMASAIYAICRISKVNKTLSFVLGSVFLAYFLQGLFLFDVLPTFLGLFPFLAFVAFQYDSAFFGKNASGENRQLQNNRDGKKNGQAPLYVLLPVGFLSLFLIYATVFLPYRANIMALKFYVYTESGIYKEAKSFLEQSFSVKSPYTFWEARKRTAWQFVNILDYGINEQTKPADITALKEIYDYIVPKAEEFSERKPYDPQFYYILGRTYRLGNQKLGKEDLSKAEKLLRKGLNYSDGRIEYYNELTSVLVRQGKIGEADAIARDFINKSNIDKITAYVVLGHLYFSTERYEQAMEAYAQAKSAGYKFYEDETDYVRYMFSAEQVKDYLVIIDMATNRLKIIGPDADTYYNIAVGYANIGDQEKAAEFFLKAVELNKSYEEFRAYFIQ